MDILFTNTGNHMKNIEKYYIYIYGEIKNGAKINDNSTISGNKIFDIVIKYEISQTALSFSY
jgi:hypothetical protein